MIVYKESTWSKRDTVMNMTSNMKNGWDNKYYPSAMTNEWLTAGITNVTKWTKIT